MNIVNVGYDSTNYYVIADARPRLMIDCGWPGTMPKLQHECKRTGVDLAAIKHLLITHYHPDHAGLAQELKRIGMRLIVMENQPAFMPMLGTYMKPEHPFVEIEMGDNLVLAFGGSRAFLAEIGIAGEIIATPGHSDDSVTLILDDGAAFTGDLGHPMIAEEGSALNQSWQKVHSMGARMVHPGHGPVWRLT